MALLYPDPRHPYYIVTPPYEVTSAGIRCLHLLCHSLNRRGQTAYIVQDPLSYDARLPFNGGPNFDTPPLDRASVEYNVKTSKVPIVIYPETISGNPFKASCVVRYVLNFPGHLGGEQTYDGRELVYGFTKALAAACGVPDNILYIPWIDTRLFKLPNPGTIRKGTCFYASKYRKTHGGVPSAITAESLEITRDEPSSQSTEEVASILQTSELFYSYENTALAVEAVLCGCPVVYLPNPYLDRLVLSHELGSDGMAWGAEPQEVARAKATVAEGAAAYFKSIEDYWSRLDAFIAVTQDHAEQSDQDARVWIRTTSDRIYASLAEAVIAENTRWLPSRLEREIGKFMSTVGAKKLGAVLWDSSLDRTRRGRNLRIRSKD